MNSYKKFSYGPNAVVVPSGKTFALLVVSLTKKTAETDSHRVLMEPFHVTSARKNPPNCLPTSNMRIHELDRRITTVQQAVEKEIK